MRTAAATTDVQRPFLSPSADCATFDVLMINPLDLKSCYLSSQAVAGSNPIPIVVASIVAAKSSA